MVGCTLVIAAGEIGIRLAAGLVDRRSVRVVLCSDDVGRTASAIAALELADRGPHIELVTPDQAAGLTVSELWTAREPGADAAALERHRAPGVVEHHFVVTGLVEEPLDLANGALAQLLRAIGQVKREVEIRCPEYFERFALRCGFRLPGSLWPVTSAVRVMLELAEHRPDGAHWELAPEAGSPAIDLADEIGRIYDLELHVGAADESLTAIDRRVEAQVDRGTVAAMTQGMVATAQAALGGRAWPQALVAGDVRAALARWRRFCDGRAQAEIGRVAVVVEGAVCRTAVSPSSRTDYFTVGERGEPVVLVNALGQGMRYWDRLIGGLAVRHRVAWWGASDRDAGCGEDIEAQRARLDAVIRQHDVPCHIVAWCTGPKVAMQYAADHAEHVASLVCLAGAFRPIAGCSDLDTAYEQSLEPLCRLLDERPAVAASVIAALRGWAVGELDELGDDPRRAAEHVLASMDPALRASVLAPFADEPTAVQYAQRMVAFWRVEVQPLLVRVRVPTLVIGAEYDRIASPRLAERVAGSLPRGRYVELAAATHHVMYDRPGEVVRLLEAFWAAPGNHEMTQPCRQ